MSVLNEKCTSGILPFAQAEMAKNGLIISYQTIALIKNLFVR
jgi:hypothetical protein